MATAALHPLSLVVDANIPFARTAFSAFGDVAVLPGVDITREAVEGADVLIVRSVTRVDRSLVQHSGVRFVGTATIGTDHIDLPYLTGRGIAFASAPGSNAESVVEYVLAALLTLAVRHDRPLRGLTAGVVGVGNVGRRLAPRLRALGMDVLLCDPPRALEEGAEAFVVLETVLEKADLVSLHVPLVLEGPDATQHLLNQKTLARMKNGAWLVNAARGAVVDNAALLEALERGPLGAAVLDVWENEPTPLPALVARADLATPHIAGYSFDGKVAGTVEMVRALERWSGISSDWDVATALAPSPDDALTLHASAADLPEHAYLHTLAQQMYDIEADDTRMRVLLDLPAEDHAAYFRALRRDYPRRRRWGLFGLDAPVPEAYREPVRGGLRCTLA